MGATEMENESLRVSAARKKLNEQKLNEQKTERQKLSEQNWTKENSTTTTTTTPNQIKYITKVAHEKHAKLTDWFNVRWRTYQDRNDGPINTI